LAREKELSVIQALPYVAYILDLSEQQLYMYTQAGITLFGQVLNDVFEQNIKDYMP